MTRSARLPSASEVLCLATQNVHLNVVVGNQFLRITSLMFLNLGGNKDGLFDKVR